VSKVRTGDPDPEQISASFVKQQNLTMRMAMRRFVPLTNGFSKKPSHLKAAVALHLPITISAASIPDFAYPAMEARISDRV